MDEEIESTIFRDAEDETKYGKRGLGSFFKGIFGTGAAPTPATGFGTGAAPAPATGFGTGFGTGAAPPATRFGTGFGTGAAPASLVSISQEYYKDDEDLTGEPVPISREGFYDMHYRNFIRARLKDDYEPTDLSREMFDINNYTPVYLLTHASYAHKNTILNYPGTEVIKNKLERPDQYAFKVPKGCIIIDYTQEYCTLDVKYKAFEKLFTLFFTDIFNDIINGKVNKSREGIIYLQEKIAEFIERNIDVVESNNVQKRSTDRDEKGEIIFYIIKDKEEKVAKVSEDLQTFILRDVLPHFKIYREGDPYFNLNISYDCNRYDIVYPTSLMHNIIHNRLTIDQMRILVEITKEKIDSIMDEIIMKSKVMESFHAAKKEELNRLRNEKEYERFTSVLIEFIHLMIIDIEKYFDSYMKDEETKKDTNMAHNFINSILKKYLTQQLRDIYLKKLDDKTIKNDMKFSFDIKYKNIGNNYIQYPDDIDFARNNSYYKLNNVFDSNETLERRNKYNAAVKQYNKDLKQYNKDLKKYNVMSKKKQMQTEKPTPPTPPTPIIKQYFPRYNFTVEKGMFLSELIYTIKNKEIGGGGAGVGAGAGAGAGIGAIGLGFMPKIAGKYCFFIHSCREEKGYQSWGDREKMKINRLFYGIKDIGKKNLQAILPEGLYIKSPIMTRRDRKNAAFIGWSPMHDWTPGLREKYRKEIEIEKELEEQREQARRTRRRKELGEKRRELIQQKAEYSTRLKSMMTRKLWPNMRGGNRSRKRTNKKYYNNYNNKKRYKGIKKSRKLNRKRNRKKKHNNKY
jgi:hypothetical protein